MEKHNQPQKGYNFSSLFVNFKIHNISVLEVLCYFLCMRTEKEILIKKKSTLFSSLAKTVIDESYEPIVGKSMKNELISLLSKAEADERRREVYESGLARRDKIASSLDVAMKKCSSLNRELEGAYARLGGLLFEKRKVDGLSDEIDFMDDDYQVYMRLQEGMRSPIKRVLAKLDSAAFEKDAQKRYVSYAEKLFSSGKDNLLSGDEFDALKDEIALILRKLDAQNEAVGVLKGKLAKERLEEGEERSEPAVDVSKYMESYGYYLFENGQKWIDQDTPDSVLDIISEILDTERAIEEEEVRERTGENLRKARELDILIEDGIRRIDALEEEKSRLDDKINEIRRDIKNMEAEKSTLLKKNSEWGGL